MDVPPSHKKEVHDRLNMKLAKEGVKEIGDDVLRWRMSQALRDGESCVTVRHQALKR